MDNQVDNYYNIPNKFSRLNFNLKNEIMNFLPIYQIMDEVFYINKSITLALKFQKALNIFKKNIKALSNQIDFTKESIKCIIYKIMNKEKVKEYFYEICSILLLKKHKKNKNLDIDINTNIKRNVLFRFIGHNKYLKKINLKNLNYKYKENNIISLSEALMNCQSEIQTLNLIKDNMGKNYDDLFFFSKALEKQNQILELNLEKNEIGIYKESFKTIFESLCNNKKITYLNISSNYFGYNSEKDMKYLQKFINQNFSLKTLIIKKSYIGKFTRDIYYLTKIGCKKNSVLREINLSDNLIGHQNNRQDLKSLFSVLAENKSIVEINLSGNLLYNNDETAINNNNHIEIFGKKNVNNIIGDNNTEDNFSFICKFLELNKFLKVIDLSNNNFGLNKLNLNHLKSAIQKNKKLKRLDLTNNNFESKDKLELNDLLIKSKKLSIII